MNALTLYQLVALFLFGLGLFGIVRRKTLVGMLICVELMLNGAGLSITASAMLTPAPDGPGQLTTLLVMGLAAAEATLVLAIVLVVAKRFGETRSLRVTELKG